MVSTKTKEDTRTARKRTCVHHWMIESPNGPTSKSVCKHCGENRSFTNTPALAAEGWSLRNGRVSDQAGESTPVNNVDEILVS